MNNLAETTYTNYTLRSFAVNLQEREAGHFLRNFLYLG